LQRLYLNNNPLNLDLADAAEQGMDEKPDISVVATPPKPLSPITSATFATGQN
jgi:hypothetical protein